MAKKDTDKPIVEDEIEQPIEIDDESIEEFIEQPTEEVASGKSDKEIFKIILDKKGGLSNRGRDTIRSKNNTLSELCSTPRGIMEQMLTATDIKKLVQILDENGRSHAKWFDE